VHSPSRELSPARGSMGLFFSFARWESIACSFISRTPWEEPDEGDKRSDLCDLAEKSGSGAPESGFGAPRIGFRGPQNRGFPAPAGGAKSPFLEHPPFWESSGSTFQPMHVLLTPKRPKKLISGPFVPEIGLFRGLFSSFLGLFQPMHVLLTPDLTTFGCISRFRETFSRQSLSFGGLPSLIYEKHVF